MASHIGDNGVVDKQDILEAVLAHASENSSLLQRLESTHEAPSTLNAHLIHLQRIRDELEEHDKALTELAEIVEKQFRSHKKFRDSKARRFYYKATHMLAKFEAQKTKEEREYFSVLSKKSKAEERHALLKRDLNEAEEKKGPLEAALQEHGDVHKEIDELYESLFKGPTPGFPTEDSLEDTFYNAQRENDKIKGYILAARRAVRHLNEAARSVNKADNYTRYALADVEDSLFFFDEAWNLLSQSNESLAHALGAVGRAENELSPLPAEMQQAKKALVSNLRAAQMRPKTQYDRDTITRAVTDARSKLAVANGLIPDFIELVKQQEAVGLVEIKTTARQLEDSRQALHGSRQGIFEDVAGFGQAAPPYIECCDRADWFCALPPPPPDEYESVVQRDELPERTVQRFQEAGREPSASPLEQPPQPTTQRQPSSRPSSEGVPSTSPPPASKAEIAPGAPQHVEKDLDVVVSPPAPAGDVKVPL